MKKVMLFFAFFLAIGLTAQAQCSGGAAAASAGKSCCSSKMSKAASADASIEKRMADDGSVSYVRRETAADGSVKFVSVKFDEAANSFVNVAPPSAETEGFVKKSCTTEAAAPAAATSCGGGTAKKSCCASKADAKGASCGNKAATQE